MHREGGGSYRPLVKTFRGLQPEADGYSHLAFTPRRNEAMVNTLRLKGERLLFYLSNEGFGPRTRGRVN